jgi:prophage antirepressor-like protein
MSEELVVLTRAEILGKEFTVYGDNDAPLFVAKDVADWIGYDPSSVNKMINDVDDDEKLVGIVFRAGQKREVSMLTEHGLYEVLMLSRKEKAKEFKKQIKVILSTIRKHGAYMTDETLDEMIRTPESIDKLLIALRDERAKRAALEEENETLEVALNESQKHMTVAKYNQVYQRGKLSMRECQNLGKELSAYCRARGIVPKKVLTNDERFESTNAYPLVVWHDYLGVT